MVKLRAKDIGEMIRKTRKSQGLTQQNLALASGVGIRFISELERGKETCELGKALIIIKTLGMNIILTPPAV